MLEFRPKELVDSARSLRKEAFVQLLRGAPLLLVQVGGADETLTSALAASSAVTGSLIPPSPDGLPFRTATAQGRLGDEGRSERGRSMKGVLYAVALHKRSGAQTLSDHRICVGRSRTNDVVLRDPSVSKLHAWFERNEEGSYFLSDVGSHNGTCVNREQLLPRQARDLASGDALQFGSVSATFLSSADFWDAVRESP